VPTKAAKFSQELKLSGDNLHVHSLAEWPGASLATDVALCLHNHEPHCCVSVSFAGTGAEQVAVSLRPYNPEGISFVEKIAVTAEGGGWLVNARNLVLFDRQPARVVLSSYQDGDVSHRLEAGLAVTSAKAVNDSVGMATAVALFPAEALRSHPLEVRMPLFDELEPRKPLTVGSLRSWPDALAPMARLAIGDARVQQLYDAAVANLVLLAPDEIYPGPYTYKRFWFRDAAFMLHALLTLGEVERTRRVLRHFAPRQRSDGYFLSQEGEWDSNGEALWTYHRFLALTGGALPEEWAKPIEKGARWIIRKRLRGDSGLPEAGLLPAGFSAEHLGPNDFYYWDDFWGVAGLRSAAEMLHEHAPRFALECRRVADELMAAIERSFPRGPHRRFPGAMPASPKRRMDSGAVGSLVADYPLHLFPPGDERTLKTVDYLRDHSSHGGGFFQNMIHSGINAYLTLHLAQVRLRAGQTDAAWELMSHVAALASSTGQWPEAIHPRTGGGCMGDGQHIWAAAEWALMVRACFVREEAGRLVLASGVRPEWWREGGARFGATLTPFGPLTVRIEGDARRARVVVDGAWRPERVEVEVRLPGFAPQQRAVPSGPEEFQLSPSS
jgi:hypothetical protein